MLEFQLLEMVFFIQHDIPSNHWRKTMRKTLFVASLMLALASASAIAKEGSSHYVFLVNDAKDNLVSLTATSPEGVTTEYLGADDVMRGNDNRFISLKSTEKGTAGCVYTIDATFSDGDTLKVENYNVCQIKTFHAGEQRRAARRNKN